MSRRPDVTLRDSERQSSVTTRWFTSRMTAPSTPTSAFSSSALSGKRVVIAGGTRGIGAATAALVTDLGAQVVVAARSQPESVPTGVTFVQADMSTPDGPRRFVEAATDVMTGVDVCVFTSGGQSRRPGGVLDLQDSDYVADFESNVLAAVRLDRAVVPHMIEQGSGVIVHVSSLAARRIHMPLGYAAAKAALSAYSKGMAGELAGHGIRVNAVLPGMARTERMNERLTELADESGSGVEDALAGVVDHFGVPMGRAADPREVASAIAFLASDASSYITGTQFAVDGGLDPNV
jgi:NAD(P)-dependent dehydrogenase (short-subunit alcohol dehydrogenase family)